MCQIGERVRVSLLCASGIPAWRIVQKDRLNLRPAFRMYGTFKIGVKAEAIDPYSYDDNGDPWRSVLNNRKVKGFTDQQFFEYCFGFWAFKTRKQARQYRKESFGKHEMRIYRLAKVTLYDRVVIHENGYRAEAMTVDALVS